MFDVLNVFTRNQTTGSFFQTVTADAISTNVINLDVAGISIVNPAKPLFIIIKSGDAFLTMVTMEIQLRTATAANLTSGRKDIAMWRFTAAQMAANTLLVNTPIPVADYQQFLGMNFNVFTNATGGTIFVGLSDTPETAETDIDLTEAGS